MNVISAGKASLQHVVAFAVSRHGSQVLGWLAEFGGMGLFTVSVVDSSIIPLPLPGSTDLLLLLLVAQRASAWWMAVAAILGSIVGGYLTWSTGVKGGEAAIKRYVSESRSRRLTRWVEAHGMLAVAASSLLPPPVPLLPFLLAAGALGVPRRKFLLSYSAARTVRYSFVAWLGATYGRRMERVWSHYLTDWGAIIMWTFIGLLVAGVLFGIWRWRRMERSSAAA